ncbi:MAG: hypothetical protein ACREPQ_14655 [Rhodanobacter sp.]
MMTFRSLRLTVLTAAMIALAGCGTMQQINQQSMDRYHATDHQLDDAMGQRPSPATPVAPIESDFPYVNTVAMAAVSELPEVFNQAASLNAPAGPAWQLMQRLQLVTGMAVHADDDVLDGTHGGNAAPVAHGLDATLAPPPSVSGGGSEPGARASAQLSAIAYQGTTKSLLDLIAGHLDATWKFDPQTHSIHIYRYESRVLHIDAVPGDSSVETGVESGQTQQIQGGQGQTVSVGQTPSKTAFTGKLDVWKALLDNIKPLLSTAGTLEVNESMASITVRDRWDRVDAVAKYVDQMNRSLDTQIEVNVKIYRVQQNDSDNRGINWNILYNTLGQAASNFGVSIATPQPTATGLASLILNSPTKTASGAASLFSGSQFFVNALSSLGKVSVVTNATIETVNNTPAPFKVVHSVAYVASTTSLYTSGVSSGSSSVVGAGATLQPGQVETGFDMQVLPSVSPDGHRLLLQTMLSVSTLDSMATFSSGGNSVQQPNVSARQFLNRSWMKSGQALVLAGFQDTEADNTTASPLDKSLWGLGGNRSVSNTKDELVVVITPVVTQPQTTIE